MIRLLRWALRILAAFALALLVVGWWKADEIRRLLAVNSLFEPDRIVANFSTMDALFFHVPVPRGDGPVSPLPEGPSADLPPEVAAWIADRAVTSLLILKDGAIIHESYHQGTGPEDRRISWSMAKSFLSVLFGTLVDDGTFPDLDAPVTDFAPALAGSAYEGTTIRDVLAMSSGVAFDEDYMAYDSDINRMGRVLALGGRMDGFTAALRDRTGPPGAAMSYVSIDTHVLGMVIRGATGRTIPDLLSERVIAPLGLEAEPYYLTDGTGTAFVLGGLNLTTRDYARFGQMVADGGTWQGTRIVSQDWLDLSTAPRAATAPGAPRYGYQWWIPANAPPGVTMAQGIYGQYLWIDRARNIVIVVTAADRGFDAPGIDAFNEDMLARIADSL